MGNEARPRSIVGIRIRERIKQRKLTVTAAAELIGISRPVLSYILSGRYTLSIATAFKVQSTLDLDARRLLLAQLAEQIRHHELLQDK